MENFIIGKLIKQLHIALENNFNKFSLVSLFNSFIIFNIFSLVK